MSAEALSPFRIVDARPLLAEKFIDPGMTASGDRRARVSPAALETLWLNTGTLCNLACASCYIESSPRNDALAYLSLAEAESYLDEARGLGVATIGFTGGEPFMNSDMIAMMRAGLNRGFDLLVLTNAMRPMRRHEAALEAIAHEHPGRVVMRVSLDHHRAEPHDAERGAGSFDAAIDGLCWLANAGFDVAVAGRRRAGESEPEAREGYARLMAQHGITLDHLVLFPTMDAAADVPEISEGCWEVTGVSPRSLMCATSRMVVKAKGAARPHVVACTLLPYDPRFALGERLAGALVPVALNHPHCARFCVLGGASCTA